MKKIISLLLIILITTSTSSFAIYADDVNLMQFEELVVDNYENDNNLEVMSGETRVMSRELNNGFLRTVYSLNWSIPANSYKKGTTNFTLYIGDYMNFDVSYSPTESGKTVKIGIINTATNMFNGYLSTGSLNSLVSASSAGNYVVRIQNNTAQSIIVTGTFEAVKFVGSIGTMSVPLYAQEKTNWCWAACVQMTGKYLGYTSTQTDIVTAAKGSAVNEVGNTSDYPKAMEEATNNNYTATKTSTVLTAAAISNKLSNGNPLIIALGTYSNNVRTGGHANVVIAVDQDKKYIKTNDPAGNGSVKVYKYSNITSSSATKQYDATVTISINTEAN